MRKWWWRLDSPFSLVESWYAVSAFVISFEYLTITSLEYWEEREEKTFSFPSPRRAFSLLSPPFRNCLCDLESPRHKMKHIHFTCRHTHLDYCIIEKDRNRQFSFASPSSYWLWREFRKYPSMILIIDDDKGCIPLHDHLSLYTCSFSNIRSLYIQIGDKSPCIPWLMMP